MKKAIYYRVYDLQLGQYFATGYNATSMEELISDFKSYISMSNECDDIEQFSSWGEIEDYLQGVELEESKTRVELEESKTPFEDDPHWTNNNNEIIPISII